MKITTLNVQGFTNWQNRKPKILSYLKMTDPDIIFFQEVVFIPDISDFNQVQILNQELGYAYEHCSVTRLQPSKEHAVYREGLGMLSKYPVTKSDTIVLRKESSDEHHRIVQLFDVSINQEIVRLANVHFSMTDYTDFATAHLKETLEIIAGRGEPRIIAGDFNIDHLEELSAIWGNDYNASIDTPYISFPAMNKRNDYVLLPKKYIFKSVSISSSHLSDHNAVTVEINSLL